LHAHLISSLSLSHHPQIFDNFVLATQQQNMASRALLVALVAMMLIASAAAQAAPAHKNKSSNKRCSRFPNCAKCSRTQCTVCGDGTDPQENGTGGYTCPCDTSLDYCNFSTRAWNAYVRGEGKCTTTRHGRRTKTKCPARPTGCYLCDPDAGCFVSQDPDLPEGTCAYIASNGVTVTRGRKLFAAAEDIWA
jgi:hypothetical protein